MTTGTGTTLQTRHGRVERILSKTTTPKLTGISAGGKQSDLDDFLDYSKLKWSSDLKIRPPAGKYAEF